MERCSYGFYTKRSEILDNIQKKKDQDKEQPQNPNFQQQLVKPIDKQQIHSPDLQNVNIATPQHVPSQLLSPTHNSGSPVQSKEDNKDKTIKVTNSTTITLIENNNINGEKDKDNNYPKNYFTLEPKNDKKDESSKNSITITRTIPKQSPGNQQDKSKVPAKPTKRPLQYLETLAEKAGITFEDKYEAANTLLALDKQNNTFRRPELKQPKTEPENHSQGEDFRYRNQKDEDDKLQIQQQIIQQQHQQQFQQLQQQQQQQQLQQLQQHQLQQLQQQALQRQHQAIQQHLKNQQDQQELLQKQFQQQQQQQSQQQQQQQSQQQQQQQHQPKTEIQQLSQQQDLQQQKFLQVVNNQPVHTQQFNVPGIGEINLSFLASPQNNVNLLFDKNQKAGMSGGDIKSQQIVDSQSQVVQQQISMAQHEPSQQHHQTVTVVSSMPSSMAQHQVQQQQTSGGIQQQATMPSLQSLSTSSQHPQQISADWGSRVQVIQQPLQNSTYLQQLYNTQGPLIMPGNIALHPGINSQQIQVIAAGKPFQGNQLAPHMLTAQGKQVLQGQATSFPGYTTIPAIPTTQNQTFVFSPLGVINSQSSILPTHSQSTVSGIGQQQKTAEMHKVMTGGKVTATKVGGATAQTVPVQAQCVQVSQPVLGQQAQAQIISPLPTGAQTMQFAPWQISGALPQVWTGGLQAGALPAGGLLAPNPIFIRGTQPDTTPSMFIQHSPQSNLQHNSSTVACSTTTSKPRASSDGLSKTTRPLSNILPSGIRPASSVSTQTSANQTQNQAKQRGKAGVRSPAPTSKQDAANQTNKMQHQQQPKQQLLVMNSSGQMTQIASVSDKQPLAKNIQQQQILQQQALQQQQQQQLMQQQQNQQMVHHYQQQGMTLGMQQSTMPVGSVAQTLPMTGMPQTISMVQQIHPLSGMAQASTIVGQLNASQPQSTLTQVQTLQQPQTLVGGGLVQTSVGIQPQSLNQSVPLHTPRLRLEPAQLLTPVVTSLISRREANNIASQLALQQGTMGLITAPVQGSVVPLQPQTTLVTQQKSDGDKGQMQSTSEVQQISGQEDIDLTLETTVSASTSTSDRATSSSANITDLAVSTTTSTGHNAVTESTKKSPSKASSSERIRREKTPSASSTSSMIVLSSAQTTSSSPKVVTTVACSSSSITTSAIGTQVSSGSSSALFKTSQSTSRHITQPTCHDKGLPKAMVKPNILTHVIEGYVIQEAAEPFAVNRPLRDWVDKEQDKENKLPSADEPPRKRQMLDHSHSHSSTSMPRISSTNDSIENTPSNSKSEPIVIDLGEPSPTEPRILNANKWTVGEVCDFIRNIPGCAAYADEFLMQEVDGEALLLIKPEHLVMALSMKLGPALKIVACIDSLRPETERSTNEQD